MQPEANRNVDQTKLAEALREILTNHQLPFRDRVKEIMSNDDMYKYIVNILEDLVTKHKSHYPDFKSIKA